MIITKEQFKEVILKALKENLNNCRGHWIRPDGKSFDVDYSHERTAFEIVKNLFTNKKISQKEFDNIGNEEEFLYNRGWIRGVKDTYLLGALSEEYYVNGKKNQNLTPKQIQWLKEYGKEFNRNVVFLPQGDSPSMRGVKFIHHTDDVLQEISVVVKPVTLEQEKSARFFIYSVWRYMPKDDRFSPYQFSLWMDNESHLQSMKMRMAERIFPNENDASEKFFHDIITPTLEKLENQYNARRAKKIDKNDPLFILKSIMKGTSFNLAKQTLYKNNLNASWYKSTPVSDEDAEGLFERLYRLAMGETMYDENRMSGLPYLTELKNPSDSVTENLFVQHYAGWRAEKFPDKVTVWRGTNSPHNDIRPGDFTTLDKDYAYSYVTGKFGTVVKSILPSKDLKVYKMDIDTSELMYWPYEHTIKKYTDKIPSLKEFWAEFR